MSRQTAESRGIRHNPAPYSAVAFAALVTPLALEALIKGKHFHVAELSCVELRHASSRLGRRPGSRCDRFDLGARVFTGGGRFQTPLGTRRASFTDKLLAKVRCSSTGTRLAAARRAFGGGMRRTASRARNPSVHPSEDHSARAGLQHAGNSHTDVSAQVVDPLLDNDHRAVVQITHAL